MGSKSALVGLPVIVQGANSVSLLIGWAVAYALFALLFLADIRWPRVSLLALQAACVIVTVLLLCDGFEGTLMLNDHAPADGGMTLWFDFVPQWPAAAEL